MNIKITLPNGISVYIDGAEYEILKHGREEEIYIKKKEKQNYQEQRITEPIYR